MANLWHPLTIVVTLVVLAAVRFIDEFNKAFAAEAGKSFYAAMSKVISQRARRFGEGKLGYVILGVISLIGIGGGITVILTSPHDCDAQKSGYALVSGATGALA